MKRTALLVAGLLLVGACAPAAGSRGLSPALCDVAEQPMNSPREGTALIEISAGGRVKYEFDAKTGRLVADRVLPDSLAYPANYGTFPCTMAGDGDPLDVLVLTDAPLDTSAIVRVRPIGVLQMYDRGLADDKVIAVLLDSPLTAVPEPMQRRISAFFSTYKGPGADIEVGPWLGAARALEILRDATVAVTLP